MQYVPKHTWKLLARVRQVIMAVNINLTWLHSAFNKYLDLCLRIFKHDFIAWTNIQRSDTYYKSALWHGTKTVIQMQTFYSYILNQCKPHQKMVVTVLDIAVLWQSLLLLWRTSILHSSFWLMKLSIEITSHLWEWWQCKTIIIWPMNCLIFRLNPAE